MDEHSVYFKPRMQKERCNNFQKACEELDSELNKIASVLYRDAIRQQALREDEDLTEH